MANMHRFRASLDNDSWPYAQSRSNLEILIQISSSGSSALFLEILEINSSKIGLSSYGNSFQLSRIQSSFYRHILFHCYYGRVDEADFVNVFCFFNIALFHELINFFSDRKNFLKFFRVVMSGSSIMWFICGSVLPVSSVIPTFSIQT